MSFVPLDDEHPALAVQRLAVSSLREATEKRGLEIFGERPYLAGDASATRPYQVDRLRLLIGRQDPLDGAEPQLLGEQPLGGLSNPAAVLNADPNLLEIVRTKPATDGELLIVFTDPTAVGALV